MHELEHWNPNMFRVIVAGSRGFSNYEYLAQWLDYLLQEKRQTHRVIIVSGTAEGADKLGERYAEERELDIQRFPADWATHGKKAGYLRNVQMAEYANAAVVFWLNGSRGAKHMIDIANERGLPVRVIEIGST